MGIIIGSSEMTHIECDQVGCKSRTRSYSSQAIASYHGQNTDLWRLNFQSGKWTCKSCCEHPGQTLPAHAFVEQIAANVDNNKLTDAEFRAFIRNTLPIVIRHKDGQ